MLRAAGSTLPLSPKSCLLSCIMAVKHQSCLLCFPLRIEFWQRLPIPAAVVSVEIWRQVEKPSGKTSRICTKCRGGCKAGSEHLPGLSFVLGRHKEKGFPLEENFLTEKTVSSLYRERVDSFGSVFCFLSN